MMPPLSIIEGTWDEIVRYARGFPVEQRFRLVPLPIEDEDAIAVMRQLAERASDGRVTNGTEMQGLIREARSGGAYGHDPGE
jgi:hypothetical protein